MTPEIMTFSAYMPTIKEVFLGTKYILNGRNNENYKLFNDAYDDSVTNSSCINDLCNFIVGKGLVNKNVNGKNPNIYISKVDVKMMVLDFEKQGATYAQVVWYGGKPVKIFHVPIENTGLNVDTDMKINGYWYCYDWIRQFRFTPQFCNLFDGTPPDGGNGTQMVRIVRPSNEPLFVKPHWFPALRWAQDEGLMAQHSFSDISTGFSGQKVVNWLGGRGLTDQQKKDTAKNIRENFSGIKGQRLIVNIGNSPEQAVVVDSIEPVNVNGTYVNYTEEAERKILIAHSYPSILLAGSKTGFSSNADEIAVATKSLYRRKINPDREIILNGLNNIFKFISPDFELDFEDFEEEKQLDNNLQK
jgi:hypothetical protein